VPQHRGLAKHGALGDGRERRRAVGVEHREAAAHKDEHVAADLAFGLGLRLGGWF
jgi:hypothetical protein